MKKISFGNKTKNGKKGGRKGKKLLLILILLLVVILGVYAAVRMKTEKAASANVKEVRTATVETRDITSELSSSGTISPKNTYDITSLVEGEVIAADFEEGDQVEAGQILYQIDTSSMESELTSVNNSLTRAQENYEVALDDYNTALSDYSGNTYKSTEAGYIRTLYIKEGDKVSSNTKIADIYDDKVMKIKLPFLSGEAAFIGAGSGATLTLTDTGEQLAGTVTAVSNMDVTLTGGRIVRYVTIEVANPGGLTTDMAATATVGDFICSAESSFEPTLETVMNADISSSVEVGKLLISEGDYVGKGTPVFTMESKSAEKLLRTYKDSVEKAEETLESARNKVESTQDNYDNYTITAPISGQVITKNVKAGDKVYGTDDTVTEAKRTVPAGLRAVDVKTGLISDDYVEITEGLSEGDVVYVAESTVSSSFNMMGGIQVGPGEMDGGGAPGGGPGGNGGNGGRSGGNNGGGPR